MTAISIDFVSFSQNRLLDQTKLSLRFSCTECHETEASYLVALPLFVTYLHHCKLQSAAALLQGRVSILKDTPTDEDKTSPIVIKNDLGHWNVIIPQIDLHNASFYEFDRELCYMVAIQKGVPYQPVHYHAFDRKWMVALSELREAFTEPYTIDLRRHEFFAKRMYDSIVFGGDYFRERIQGFTHQLVCLSDPMHFKNTDKTIKKFYFYLTVGNRTKVLICQEKVPVFHFKNDVEKN